MDREIHADGGVNLRDIGGYTTVTGHRVRWRRVLRSGHFNDLSPEGQTTLSELGVRTVLDLREQWEIEAMPSDWCGGRDFEVVHAPRAVGSNFDNRQLLRWDRATSLQAARAQRIETYRRKPFDFAPALGRLFEALADASSYPVLFHCMTGKDRTGFTAAVLLSWLGVERESIVEDYMLTTRIVGRMPLERVQRILQLYGLEQTDAEGLRVLSEVRPEYIEASLDRIEEEFGGIERYLEEYVGVDPARRSATREHLLEG